MKALRFSFQVTVVATEPTIAEMKEVLVKNYSEKDEEALEVLCVQFEGRRVDLEKYLTPAYGLVCEIVHIGR